jgi:hypothetical protein
MLVPKTKLAQIFLEYSSNDRERKAIIDFVADDFHANLTGKTEREIAQRFLNTVLQDVAICQVTQGSHSSPDDSYFNSALPHEESMDLRSLLQSLGTMADALQCGNIFRNVFQGYLITGSWPDVLISFITSRMVKDALQTKTSESFVWEQW